MWKVGDIFFRVNNSDSRYNGLFKIVKVIPEVRSQYGLAKRQVAQTTQNRAYYIKIMDDEFNIPKTFKPFKNGLWPDELTFLKIASDDTFIEDLDEWSQKRKEEIDIKRTKIKDVMYEYR